MIPLAHDFTGETVVVFGGGPVGARKARRFAAEARVVVVSPAFADADFGGAERVRAAPAPDEVAAYLDDHDPALVVAATDDRRVNAAAARAARDRGALVNRADRSGRDDRDPGDVAVPATVADGDVTVAVSTGGASPALARHLRERIEDLIDGAGAVAAASGALRERYGDGVGPDERRAAVRAVVRADEVWRAAREDGFDAALAAAERIGGERIGGEESADANADAGADANADADADADANADAGADANADADADAPAGRGGWSA